MPVKVAFHGASSIRSNSNFSMGSIQRFSIAQDDADYFYEQRNEELMDENEALKIKGQKQQLEIERLEAVVQMAQGDALKPGGSQRRASVVLEERPTAVVGSEKAKKVDLRKVLDDFKRPLDDTQGILSEFAHKKDVPVVLALAQAEATQSAQRKLQLRSAALSARIAELERRKPHAGEARVTAQTKQRQKAHADALKALKEQARRTENDLGAMIDTLGHLRDAAIARTFKELCKELEGYSKAMDDLSKGKVEGAALQRLVALCAPFSLEALDEREEAKPRQPPDLGMATQVRTSAQRTRSLALGARVVHAPQPQLTTPRVTPPPRA
jgi:hypothetical protein